MTDQRKQEIVAELKGIHSGFALTGDETELTMFGLVSRYNATGHNVELIGGDWVLENCPEPICSLPS